MLNGKYSRFGDNYDDNNYDNSRLNYAIMNIVDSIVHVEKISSSKYEDTHVASLEYIMLHYVDTLEENQGTHDVEMDDYLEAMQSIKDNSLRDENNTLVDIDDSSQDEEDLDGDTSS